MKRTATILVVDDELDVREMIAAGLSFDGHRVITAAGGAQAIGLLDGQTIDLLITDFKMLGMDGVEAAVRLRQVAPDLPIIVVTGYLAPSTIEDWRALGNVELIRKPFEFRVLSDAVAAAIGGG